MGQHKFVASFTKCPLKSKPLSAKVNELCIVACNFKCFDGATRRPTIKLAKVAVFLEPFECSEQDFASIGCEGSFTPIAAVERYNVGMFFAYIAFANSWIERMA